MNVLPRRTGVGNAHKEHTLAMPLRFIPQERAFFDLFRRDIAACKEGAALFTAMLRDYHAVKDQARRIHDVEHEGDRVTAEVFALINRTFVTPFEREDLIALGSIIDTVLDQIDEVATMLVLYGIAQPSVYLLEASTLLVGAVDELAAAIDLLQSLKGLHPHLQAVHRLEHEADQLYYNAVAELFLPDAYTPLEVIKWKSLYDLVERAFDKCEDVANVLENIVIKNG